MRRNLIYLALSLVLVPATVVTVFKQLTPAELPDPPEAVLTFSAPSHRVAMAVDEAMRADLFSVVRGEATIYSDDSFNGPDGTDPAIDEFKIPEGASALWIAFPDDKTVARLAVVRQFSINAKTYDGRDVQVTIKEAPLNKGSLVDCHGNEAVARLLSPRIADRLANPRYKHESPEDRAALMTFFEPLTPTKALHPLKKGASPRKKAYEPDGVDPSCEDQ